MSVGLDIISSDGHVRRYLTNDATQSLVNGLVASRLDCCNALLSGLHQTSINKLQRVQNTAARFVTRTSRYSHITPALKNLHWLPVNYRVQFKILMRTYKALHGQAPGHISDMLNVYQPRRKLRSMDSLTLVQRARTVTYDDRKFQCSAAMLWNALPAHIREAKLLNTFKKLLKTHLFLAHFGA